MTKYQEAVEAMARVMCQNDLKEGRDFNAVWDEEKWVWLKEASEALTAALKVLREPDEDMLDAGAYVSPQYDDLATPPITYWQAMLDAVEAGK